MKPKWGELYRYLPSCLHAFVGEPFMTVLVELRLVGIIQRLIRTIDLLQLWFIVPFLTAGRSAMNLVIIPLAMLAAVEWVVL